MRLTLGNLDHVHIIHPKLAVVNWDLNRKKPDCSGFSLLTDRSVEPLQSYA